MIGTITKKENETNLLYVKSVSEYQETSTPPPKVHHKYGKGKRKKSGRGEESEGEQQRGRKHILEHPRVH